MWPPTKPRSQLKEKVEIVQALVTILAVIIGGLWTYDLFVKERHEYPHANIDLKISHVAFSDRANLFRIGVELTNSGNSLMKIEKSVIRVQQILPLPPCPTEGRCAANEIDEATKMIERQDARFPWELIAERNESYATPIDIEPGEKQNLDFEFAISPETKVVRVYAYFRNDQRSRDGSEIGWQSSGYYDFRGPAGVQTK